MRTSWMKNWRWWRWSINIWSHSFNESLWSLSKSWQLKKKSLSYVMFFIKSCLTNLSHVHFTMSCVVGFLGTWALFGFCFCFCFLGSPLSLSLSLDLEKQAPILFTAFFRFEPWSGALKRYKNFFENPTSSEKKRNKKLLVQSIMSQTFASLLGLIHLGFCRFFESSSSYLCLLVGLQNSLWKTIPFSILHLSPKKGEKWVLYKITMSTATTLKLKEYPFHHFH